MVVASTVFAAGAAWLGVTWIGFPAWLGLRARFAPRPVVPAVPSGSAPSVTVVCVVRNAEAAVDARMAELRRLCVDGEASGAVDVVMVDDGSTDTTAARVAAFAAEWPAMELVRQAHLGKVAGLRAGAERARGDVLVFCDVRQRIPVGALAALLRPFADPAVGAVSGLVDEPVGEGSGLYRRYENWIRTAESRSGSTIGAAGAWHALRAELFRPPPDGLLLDDVWLPMAVVLAGYRAVVAEDARLREVAHALKDDRRRKARTLAGNLQLVERMPALLNPRANPVWARFVGHKLLRLGSPWALAAVAGASLIGALTPGPAQPSWALVVAAEVAVVLAAKLGWGPARAALELHGAAAEAWWRWLRRDFRWS